jgi:phosphatidylglycerol---prolipoprotein diacylglyceryl transferase
MHQVLYTIPVINIPITGYGLMLSLAFLAGLQLACWRAQRVKLDPDLIYDLSFWMLIGGLIGARLFFVVEYHDHMRSVWDAFKVWKGGIVFYGSVIGATASFFMYWKLRPFPLRPVLDAIAPAVALGIALGLVGCFLNGCCYGDPCDSAKIPWAVRFPAESPPWYDQLRRGQLQQPKGTPGTAEYSLKDETGKVVKVVNAFTKSLPVHPTQIYSALDGLVLLCLLSAYYPLRRRDGEVMALLMVTYAIGRFLTERLRNDESAMFAGLTVSQLLSIVLFVCGLIYWYRLSRMPALRYADTTDVVERQPVSRPHVLSK